MQDLAEAVTVDNVKARKLLDNDGKFYRLIIQVGANCRWRKCGGGRWKRNESEDAGDGKAYLHVPALHETGSITSVVANGLIEFHNRWIERNKKAAAGGAIEQQLLVLSLHVTDEVPPEVEKMAGGGPAVAALKICVREAVKAALEEVKTKK